MFRLRISLFALVAACGGVEYNPTDAGVDTPIDEPSPDASPPPPAPGRDIAVAAGRLTGGTLTLDVQLGGVDQSRITGGVFTATTAAPLNP
jgi:hypothetical protein